MKFLFIEPFSIGSHALFAQGFAAHSTHSMDLVEMPGKNFRWRMLGSALYLANHIKAIDTYNGIIATDLFNLADFKALTGPKCPPVGRLLSRKPAHLSPACRRQKCISTGYDQHHHSPCRGQGAV